MCFVVSSRFRRRAETLDDRRAALLRAARRCFAVDPCDLLLRTDKLKGALAGYWVFTVDDVLRVLLRWDGNMAFLVNLGSYYEVY